MTTAWAMSKVRLIIYYLTAIAKQLPRGRNTGQDRTLAQTLKTGPTRKLLSSHCSAGNAKQCREWHLIYSRGFTLKLTSGLHNNNGRLSYAFFAAQAIQKYPGSLFLEPMANAHSSQHYIVCGFYVWCLLQSVNRIFVCSVPFSFHEMKMNHNPH